MSTDNELVDVEMRIFDGDSIQFFYNTEVGRRFLDGRRKIGLVAALLDGSLREAADQAGIVMRVRCRRWVRCDRQMPDDDRRVLAAYECAGLVYPAVSRWGRRGLIDEKPAWRNLPRGVFKVTHWRDLDDAPEGEDWA